jgi:hypothetical protein
MRNKTADRLERKAHFLLDNDLSLTYFFIYLVKHKPKPNLSPSYLVNFSRPKIPSPKFEAWAWPEPEKYIN